MPVPWGWGWKANGTLPVRQLSRPSPVFKPIARWSFHAPNVFRYHQPDSTEARAVRMDVDNISCGKSVGHENVNLDFHPFAQWNASGDQCSMSVDHEGLTVT